MSFGREERSHRRSRAADRRSPRGRVPRRLLLLLILLVVALTLHALGALFAWRSLGDDVSGKSVATDSIDSGPTPNLRISNGSGAVRVEGVEGLESIELEATKHALGSNRDEARRRASEISTNLSRDGAAFVIEAGGERRTGIDYALRVPRGSSVEVESEAGDVQVLGLDGDVTAHAGAGDVTIENAGGSVEVRATRGDVVISDVNTDTGQVAVSVGVGDASMENLVVGPFDARVETGDVILSGRFSGSGEALVQTGDVVVRLPPEDTRELTLEARIGDVVRGAGATGEE
ncbi:MAG TPA: DUF4097 family beta strand repeat-containing protein [Rubrobacteraceae bacterium]|nr:DUF4097 family beta strand repeat-containing protein [Rubrobacteraceae bacterium]